VKKIFVCGISAVLLSLQAWAQTDYISSGKIIFERRTNLEKRFNDQRMKRFVTEANKIRIESFQLAFNDTSSYFAVVPSNEPEEMAWLTTKNAYYQNLNESSQLMMLAVFGQNVYVQDSLPQRIWKITEGKRNICGYECRKAIYQKNDSTRIYAWYATSLVPSIGPEGFCGLPGTILGVATEDGGIIYFAKKVEFIQPKSDQLVSTAAKNKAVTLKELKADIEKKYGSQPWGRRMFDDLFRWL
jgi:GLPGLI family protein